MRRLIVDAQIHMWPPNRPDRPWVAGAQPQIPEPFTIERVVPMIDEAGVDRVVIVPPTLEGNRIDYAQEAVRRREDLRARGDLLEQDLIAEREPSEEERSLAREISGVTELQARPAIDTDELRAACNDWPGRVEDHAYLRHDPALPDLLERAGATLIGYRSLRELQRAG